MKLYTEDAYRKLRFLRTCIEKMNIETTNFNDFFKRMCYVGDIVSVVGKNCFFFFKFTIQAECNPILIEFASIWLLNAFPIDF